MKKVSFRVRNFDQEQFITYNIDNEAELDEDVLEFLEEEEPKGIVPIIFEEEEEFDTFSYNVSDKIRMCELSNQEINAEMVLMVMRGLVLSLLDMAEYRIPLSYLVLHRNYIYINSDYEVEFICIPLEDMQEEVDLTTFLRNFVATLRFDSAENGDYVAKLLSFINNPAIFNLRSMLNVIEDLMNDKGIEIPEDSTTDIYVDYQEVDNTADYIEDEPEDDTESVAEDALVQDDMSAYNIDTDMEDDTISVIGGAAVKDKVYKPEKVIEDDISGPEEAEEISGDNDADTQEVELEEVSAESEEAEQVSEEAEVEPEEAEQVSEEAEVEPEEAEQVSEEVEVEPEETEQVSEEAEVEPEETEQVSEEAAAEQKEVEPVSEEAAVELEETTQISEEDSVEPEEDKQSEAIQNVESAKEAESVAKVPEEKTAEPEEAAKSYLKLKETGKKSAKATDKTTVAKENTTHKAAEKDDTKKSSKMNDKAKKAQEEAEEVEGIIANLKKKVAATKDNTTPEETVKESKKTTLKPKTNSMVGVVLQDELDEFLAEKENEERHQSLKHSDLGLKIRKDVKVNRASVVKNTYEETKPEEELPAEEEVAVAEVEEPVSEVEETPTVNQEEEQAIPVATPTTNVAALTNTPNIPKANPYLVRVNTEERIMITKQNFKIGKAGMGVDYTVKGNAAVSRVHAIIINKADIYYIKDNKSTNHTYVNGKAIEDGQNEELTHDCKIILGDEEFIFKLR